MDSVNGITALSLPPGFDAHPWLARWDRMQERYLVARPERFALLVRLLRDVLGAPAVVLELGCGVGSLMAPILEALPQAEVYGLDLDPTMLLLARARLAPFGARAHLVTADLRAGSWLSSLPLPADAAVSATALHWLSPQQLSALYRHLAGALRPGGVFLNADHVASESPALQGAWERHRAADQARQADPGADSWDGFWQAYGQALGPAVWALRERLVGPWEGVEAGLPLAWHLDELRASGFEAVDCFWRRDCDAIYGGVRRGGSRARGMAWPTSS